MKNPKPQTRKLTPDGFRLARAAFCFLLSALCYSVSAQSTAFTYQGRLNDGSEPANGIYDLRFGVYDAANSGAQQGPTLTQAATAVSNGLFTVTLNFGSDVFTGAARWLEIEVRTTGGGGFTTMSPRQSILPTPYAMHAEFAGNIQPDANVSFSGPVTFSYAQGQPFYLAPGVTNLVQNLNAQYLAGRDAGQFWWLGGNSGQLPGDYVLGSLDNNPLTLSVNGQRALRVEPNATSPNLIGGYSGNVVSNGFAGAVIGGGGQANNPNRVGANFASVLGGYNNTAAGFAATAIGLSGTARGDYSTVIGVGNSSLGNYAMALGVESAANGNFATAMGTRAHADHAGSFVWSDLTEDNFNSTAPNQFLIRASGRVGINTNQPKSTLHVNGMVTAAAFSGSGAGLSDLDVHKIRETIGLVSAWGDNNFGQTNIPAGLSNVVAIAGGAERSLALKRDGTVVMWGLGGTSPGGLNNVGAIAAGIDHNLALKTDGTVVEWGSVFSVPAGVSNVTAIAAGDFHSLALKRDGTVVAWGRNVEGQANVPAGLSNVVAIAGHSYYSMALKHDGTVFVWGWLFGSGSVVGGLSNVVAIAGGAYHMLALRSDGTVAALGDNTYGQLNVPPDLADVVGIAAGRNHCLAVKGDGTIVAWGDSGEGQTTIPSGMGQVVAVAGGRAHSLALRHEHGAAQLARVHGGNTFSGNQTISGSLGINTPTPQAPLHVGGRAIVNGADQWDVNNTEGDFRVGSATHRFKIGVAQTGGGAGDVWMRAHGGTSRLFLKTPGGTTIYSNEGQTTGVTLASGGGAWTTVSDRNAKENFAPVDPQEVLEKVAALPLSSWNYKSQDASIRHVGPMAQDFKAAFGLGESETGITTVDADGVALAAIQGLNQKAEDRSRRAEDRIQKLERENGELKARLTKMEQLLAKLSSNQN
jgi:hypothetical protein